MAKYADIILPLAQGTYTYATADIESLEEGDAVAVQFGAKSVYTAIVARLHDEPPKRGTAKPLLARLYHRPIVSRQQLDLWRWIADYYMCTIGEVMRAALPSLIKPHAATTEEFEPYTPKVVRYLRLCCDIPTEQLEKISQRAPRQAALLNELIAAGGSLERSHSEASAATIAATVKRGLIEIYEQEPSTSAEDIRVDLLPQLSSEQLRASRQITDAFSAHQTILLHGITSSGKTEIYMHHIAETLSRGEDVLYLVPEISLTAQLVVRLRAVFGNRTVVYHSKLTPERRTQVYMECLRADSGRIVIGVRSALFLPLKRLGLVIIDEEHDASYKQSDTAPRYNGRDTALMLASLFGAKSILGSATPSVETYANTLTKKFARIELNERYGTATPPQIIISDTIRSAKRGERRSHFNKELINRIAERLERNEQVLLFQNRRGYSPYVECKECGWSPRCPSCNVTLTMHRQSNTLRCHYCSYSLSIPTKCPQCGAEAIAPMGFGTERVEEEIRRLFPAARTLRLDGDTATSDKAYREIIDTFARHDADILIGTQIIAKGLDFADVTLIGILNADNLLKMPDFRASERAWQTLIQVSGRCCRRDDVGEVVVQSADVQHPIFEILGEAYYDKMAAAQLAERQIFNYPPYSRIVRIILCSEQLNELAECSMILAQNLRDIFGNRTLGPVTPLIDKIRGEHRLEIVLKIENASSFTKARKLIGEQIREVEKSRRFRKVKIVCDVDPL